MSSAATTQDVHWRNWVTLEKQEPSLVESYVITTFYKSSNHVADIVVLPNGTLGQFISMTSSKTQLAAF
jgi:hypothetical protein